MGWGSGRGGGLWGLIPFLARCLVLACTPLDDVEGGTFRPGTSGSVRCRSDPGGGQIQLCLQCFCVFDWRMLCASVLLGSGGGEANIISSVVLRCVAAEHPYPNRDITPCCHTVTKCS